MKKPRIRSRLKQIDAHVIQPKEYEEMPELTDEELARADLYEGGKLIRRGRHIKRNLIVGELPEDVAEGIRNAKMDPKHK